VKEYFYRDRDYAFGQTILTVRTKIGLTQTALANVLGVTRRAVGDWEGGLTYPKAEHLKQFVVLAIEQQAFTAGREAEEVRALWQATHQKVVLDEVWLSMLLPRAEALPASEAGEETSGAARTLAPPAGGWPRVDWGDAPTVTTFYGREWELNLLSEWVVQERCRVVSVLGLGGIGKSALATQVMQRVAKYFEVVIWRSLRDAPSCEALLDDCLQVLAPPALHDVSASLESRQSLLVECLRSRRVLLVYDNLESFLEEGEDTGHMRVGYEGFGRMLCRVAETDHQSCWLLTSREKPGDLVPLEGSRAPVRALRLARLDADSCKQLLAEKGVTGSAVEQARLIEAYAGNPLALKIVAQTIVDLFAGQIVPFLEQGKVIFGGVRKLLDEQYARLADLERILLCWLAIVREPMTLSELRALFVAPRPAGEVLEAVDGLLRRSLIERGQHPGSFTLQSVVMEYVTDALLEHLSEEIRTMAVDHLHRYALEQAQAKDYVRETQVRVLVRPLVERLRAEFGSDEHVEEQCLSLLMYFRAEDGNREGYGPANVISLLKALRSDLRGLDLSRIVIRGAYLQGIEMQDATLSGAVMRECVFSEAFDVITAVAISRSGRDFAAISRRGEMRVWREEGKRLHLAWQAHTDNTLALALSPDEHTLASGCDDGSVKLWDVESGALLWSGWHTKGTMCLAFSPAGSLLASGGVDATVRLWEASLGTHLEELPHPSPILSLAWSPDGRLLASGDFVGTTRLWEMQQTGPPRCVEILSEHTNIVRGLAFAPDGSVLASASWDSSIKLWEIESLRCLQTLVGHTERVHCLAFSPDGDTLASGGWDTTIRLWDVKLGRSRVVLQGHSGDVYGLAFTPDSRLLLSGSNDGTLRLWEVERAQCVRVIQGSVACLYDLDWSPDGSQVASTGTDKLVTIWDVAGGRPRGVLHGHSRNVYGVAWSPDGSRLASSGWDSAIRIWDPTVGACLQIMEDSESADTLFYSLAWSPDGQLLACGTWKRGVQVWDVATKTLRWAERLHAILLRRVAWSPDGTLLAGGGDDGSIFLWDATDGTQQHQMAGHQGAVMSVAWSADGRLASGGSGREGGELFVWDADSGKPVQAFAGHPGLASALAWSPSGELLISGESDGRLCWWDVHSGHSVRVQEGHRGAVQALKVSPDGIRLASCGDDGAILLWNLHSGEHLQTLRHDRPYERLTITDIRGLTQAQKASLRALGAVEESNANR
jgi:WD40 repeat protein/transcriptional regulator with XRE-family HTH domain